MSEKRARTSVRHSLREWLSWGVPYTWGWKWDTWGDGSVIPCLGTPRGVTSPSQQQAIGFSAACGFLSPWKSLMPRSSALSGDLIPWSDPVPVWFSWSILLNTYSCSGLKKTQTNQDFQDLKYFFWLHNLSVQCGVERKE